MSLIERLKQFNLKSAFSSNPGDLNMVPGSDGKLFATTSDKMKHKRILVIVGGILAIIVARIFYVSQKNRTDHLLSRTRRLFSSDSKKDMIIKAYDHDKNRWRVKNISYMDWSGNKTTYTNPKQCIRGLNWYREPISVCPSILNNTFIVTDELNKKIHEDISVRIIGEKGQKMTVSV